MRTVLLDKEKNASERALERKAAVRGPNGIGWVGKVLSRTPQAWAWR